MIDLAKLRQDLANIRSLRARLNATIGRQRPTKAQWEALGELAQREAAITAILRHDCIVC